MELPERQAHGEKYDGSLSWLTAGLSLSLCTPPTQVNAKARGRGQYHAGRIAKVHALFPVAASASLASASLASASIATATPLPGGAMPLRPSLTNATAVMCAAAATDATVTTAATAATGYGR